MFNKISDQFLPSHLNYAFKNSQLENYNNENDQNLLNCTKNFNLSQITDKTFLIGKRTLNSSTTDLSTSKHPLKKRKFSISNKNFKENLYRRILRNYSKIGKTLISKHDDDIQFERKIMQKIVNTGIDQLQKMVLGEVLRFKIGNEKFGIVKQKFNEPFIFKFSGLKIDKKDKSDPVYQNLLGKGSFGSVQKIIDVVTGKVYAMKVSNGISEQFNRSISEEFTLLKQINEGKKNCGIQKSAKLLLNFPNRRRALITKLYNKNSLREELKSRVGSYTKKELLEMCIQLFKGLQFLHMKKDPVIHGDIKIDNILVHEKKQNRQYVLGDLGGAWNKCRYEFKNSKSVLGTAFTPSYFTESDYNLLKRIKETNNSYNCWLAINQARDVFALTSTLWRVITESRPYTSGERIVNHYKVNDEEKNFILQFPITTTLRNASLVEKKLGSKITKIFRKALSENCSHRPSISTIIAELENELENEKNPLLSHSFNHIVDNDDVFSINTATESEDIFSDNYLNYNCSTIYSNSNTAPYYGE